MYRYFRRVNSVSSGNCICFWTFKGSSDEHIRASTTSDYKLNPQ